MTAPTIVKWPADPARQPADCTGCRGTGEWGPWRRVASALCGPHSVVLDVRWLLLTMNVADAEELARLMRPAGPTYRVPALADELERTAELFPASGREA